MEWRATVILITNIIITAYCSNLTTQNETEPHKITVATGRKRSCWSRTVGKVEENRRMRGLNHNVQRQYFP